MKKAAKEASRAQRMRTEFQIHEQSITDMVAHKVQKEVSKLQTATPSAKNKQSFRKPSDSRDPRSNYRSTSRSRNQAKTGRSSNATTPQGRQSRSRTTNQQAPLKQRHGVKFSGYRFPFVRRNQPSKNVKSRANDSVK